MIQLFIAEREIIKFDAESGQTWVMKENDEDVLEWIEVKDQQEKPNA